MQQKIITGIRQTLQTCAKEQKRQTSARFYKPGETAQVYGVEMSEVRKIGKDFYKQIKDYPKQKIFDICEELWKSKYLEEAVIACTFTESLTPKYEPADFEIFEHWIKNYINNWADCDTFCNHTVGSFVMMFPDYINRLKGWAEETARGYPVSCGIDNALASSFEAIASGGHSDVDAGDAVLNVIIGQRRPERWVKRAACVSLIIPARNGMFLDDILEIAEILLLDKDDLVQKGYGWMLKAASMTEKSAKGTEQIQAKHLEAVFGFVMKHKSVMPRTALRYAIEKMPPELKAEAMKK